MVASSAANSGSFEVSTPAPEEIHFTRLFAAPRPLVFDAMTKPEHVKRWWGRLGDGYSVPVCQIDLRVGGRWRYVNRHPQGEVTFYGEYIEIAPPERLVFTETMEPYPEPGSTVTVVLTDERGKTRVSIVARYPSQEVRDIVLGTGMERGAAISYDRLEDLVVELQRR
jgi:uncharacterized protein YndB with AHSA1/START domain